MKFRRYIILFASFGAFGLAIAQNYDSTGSARLWAPNPPPYVPEKIVVPGYGAYAEGTVVSTFEAFYQDGQCGNLFERGVCTAKQGAQGYLKKTFIGSGLKEFDGWRKYPEGPSCPMNTEGYAITTLGGHGICN